MTDLRQAAQQALDALEESWHLTPMPDYARHSITALKAALEQQAEPVAWMDKDGDVYPMPENKKWAPPHVLLYTTPPQRQWVGLTDEDFLEACQIAERGNYLLALQRIQIKLKERNND